MARSGLPRQGSPEERTDYPSESTDNKSISHGDHSALVSDQFSDQCRARIGSDGEESAMKRPLVLILGIGGLVLPFSALAEDPVSVYPPVWNAPLVGEPVPRSARVPSLFGPAIERLWQGKSTVIHPVAAETPAAPSSNLVKSTTTALPAATVAGPIPSASSPVIAETGACVTCPRSVVRPVFTGHAAGKFWHWLTYKPGPAVIPKCIPTPYPGHFMGSFFCVPSPGYTPIPGNLAGCGKCTSPGSADPLSAMRRLPGGPVLLPASGVMPTTTVTQKPEVSRSPSLAPNPAPVAAPAPMPTPSSAPAPMPKLTTDPKAVQLPSSPVSTKSVTDLYPSRKAITEMYQPVGLPTADEPNLIEQVRAWWDNRRGLDPLRRSFLLAPAESPRIISTSSSAGNDPLTRTARPGVLPTPGYRPTTFRIARPDQPFTNP